MFSFLYIVQTASQGRQVYPLSPGLSPDYCLMSGFTKAFDSIHSLIMVIKFSQKT